MQLSQSHTSTYIFTDELHWKELSRDQSWSGFNAPPAKGLIRRASKRLGTTVFFPSSFQKTWEANASQQVLNHRWWLQADFWKNWKVRPWAEKGLKSFCRTCWNKLTCSILYCSNDSLCISRIWIVKWNGGSSECILAPVFSPFFAKLHHWENAAETRPARVFTTFFSLRMWLTTLNLVALYFVFTSPCGLFALKRDFVYPVQQVTLPNLPCPELADKSQVTKQPVATVEQSTSQPPETSEISRFPKVPETSVAMAPATVSPTAAAPPMATTFAPPQALVGDHSQVCSLVVEPCHVGGTFAAQTFGDIYARNSCL